MNKLENKKLLETEKLIHSISDELLNLKSAVEQYEETRNTLSNVSDSVNKISTTSTNLAKNIKTFFSKFEEIKIEERLEKIQEDSSILKQEQSNHSKSLEKIQKDNSILKKEQSNHNAMLKDLDGELKQRTDQIIDQHKNQSKVLDFLTTAIGQLKFTRYLVIGTILLQAITLMILFLK